MLSSSQTHDAENTRPLEVFTWNEDASVTERRRRRARTSRTLAWASIISAVALLVRRPLSRTHRRIRAQCERGLRARRTALDERVHAVRVPFHRELIG